MLYETTLKEWFLVTFSDAPGSSNQVLWGIVESDPSGRWDLNDWCCTSQILEKTDDGVFVTKNTRYTTVGSGQMITLPVKALIELRVGHSPDDYLTLQALQR